ncbi:MAG: protein phosphatase 2C domain-containing protein [Lachnospiraceae bacterium]|nr:protein phosphatase 2C domain-containing protein [Lachnospiraceae bacterium]
MGLFDFGKKQPEDKQSGKIEISYNNVDDVDNTMSVEKDNKYDTAGANHISQNEDEYEDEVKLPPEPVLDPLVYGVVGGVSYWGFSQRGESHLKNGLPCQDRCVIEVVDHSPIIIAAIADGVGSCMLSHYGAATATRSALEYLKKELSNYNKRFDDAFIGNLLRSAMQCAYEEVVKEAEEMEQLEYSFQSTLTIAIYDGSTLYFSHAGDDGIVAILDNGTMDLATVRKKGEEASSVMPLQSLDWETRKSTNVTAFVMATDGVLDAFVRGEKEGNRIYYPFIEPAVQPGQNTVAEVKEVADFYYDYLSGAEYRSKVTDDLTMVVITNQKKIKKENLPVFNQERWNKYSEERAAQIKAALYPVSDTSKEHVKAKKSTCYVKREEAINSETETQFPQEISLKRNKHPQKNNSSLRQKENYVEEDYVEEDYIEEDYEEDDRDPLYDFLDGVNDLLGVVIKVEIVALLIVIIIYIAKLIL